MALFDRIFHKKIDERLAAYQSELIEKHCEEVQNIYATIRGWRHDYKNHISVMQAALRMNRLDELDAYLGELTVDLNTVDTVVKTGNVMADAILNSKLALAKKRDVRLDVTAAIPEGIPLSDVELCVIVGNLLDNATEACAAVGDPAERFIRVYIGAFKEQFYLCVTNSMSGARDRRGKTYRTTKGEGHGFGLARVDGVVKKYGGYVNRRHEEGVFGTEIMIPLRRSAVRAEK